MDTWLPVDVETWQGLSAELCTLLDRGPGNSLQELFERSHSTIGKAAQLCVKFPLKKDHQQELKERLNDLRRRLYDEQTRLEIWAAEIKTDLNNLKDGDGRNLVTGSLQPLLHELSKDAQTVGRRVTDLVPDDSNETLDLKITQDALTDIHSRIGQLFLLVENVNKSCKGNPRQQHDQLQQALTQQDTNTQELNDLHIIRLSSYPSIITTPYAKLPKQGLIRSIRQKDPKREERNSRADEMAKQNSVDVREYLLKLEADDRKGKVVPRYPRSVNQSGDIMTHLDDMRITPLAATEAQPALPVGAPATQKSRNHLLDTAWTAEI